VSTTESNHPQSTELATVRLSTQDKSVEPATNVASDPTFGCYKLDADQTPTDQTTKEALLTTDPVETALALQRNGKAEFLSPPPLPDVSGLTGTQLHETLTTELKGFDLLSRYMQQRIRARVLQLLHAIAARFEAGEEIVGCKGKNGKGMGKYLRTVCKVDPGKIRVWRFRADVADQKQLLALAHEQKPLKHCSKCKRPKDRCRCPAIERIQKKELEALRGVVAAAAPLTSLDKHLSKAVHQATCSMTAAEKTKWGIRLPDPAAPITPKSAGSAGSAVEITDFGTLLEWSETTVRPRLEQVCQVLDEKQKAAELKKWFSAIAAYVLPGELGYVTVGKKPGPKK
jgi:hypothetical protein